MQFVVNLLVSTISVIIAAFLLPKVTIGGWLTALLVAVILGILNATLGVLLKLIMLPINFVTLGLVGFLINVFMIRITDRLIDDFEIAGFWYTVLFAIVIAIVNPLIHSVFGSSRKEPD